MPRGSPRGDRALPARLGPAALQRPPHRLGASVRLGLRLTAGSGSGAWWRRRRCPRLPRPRVTQSSAAWGGSPADHGSSGDFPRLSEIIWDHSASLETSQASLVLAVLDGTELKVNARCVLGEGVPPEAGNEGQAR